MDELKSDATQDKKKIQLPLFGKKKTFGFDKLRQQVSSQKSTTLKDVENNKDKPVEEFDDDDCDRKHVAQDVVQEKLVESAPKETSITKSPNAEKSCDEQINESTDEPVTERIDTEDQITENESATSKNSTDHLKPDSNESLTKEKIVIQNSSGSGASTKNRSKQRNRNKVRHQIDIDDTEEDISPQKYSGWVPPSNQSGDGMTDLNSKYGY